MGKNKTNKPFLNWLYRGYCRWMSPLLGSNCRFYPTCSEYFYLCCLRYGYLKGIFCGLKRLLRCGPWHRGGYDPPEDA